MSYGSKNSLVKNINNRKKKGSADLKKIQQFLKSLTRLYKKDGNNQWLVSFKCVTLH